MSDAQLMAELQNIIRKLREQLQKLLAENAELRRMLFGPKRERIKPIERDIKKATPKDDAARQAATRKRREKTTAKKRELPEVEVVHPIAAEDLHCGNCQGEFRPLGEGEISYEYEYVAARFVRRKHCRSRQVCRCGRTIAVAAAPTRVADGVHYGPGLHAHVAVSKCADAMPLHRQAKRFQREGIPISDSTLGDIFHRTAELLQPLHRLLLKNIACSQYVNADETPVRVQAPGKTRRAFVWTFIGGGQVAFSYSPTRSGDTPRKVLADAKGYLQVDAFSGYNHVCVGESWTRVGCLAHVRRYFFAAQETAPAEAKFAMDTILELYRVEYTAQQENILGTEAHLRLRQEKARPIWDSFHTWVISQQAQHPPKSPMGKAITYTRNAWPSLLVYLTDAKLRLDNNISEQQLRALAIGRKNFLFVGNDTAGENLAILQSLVASCEMAGVNAQDYIADVLIRIQNHPANRVHELLPIHWKKLFSSA